MGSREKKHRACRDLTGRAGLLARVTGRDTANDIHMWGVNLRPAAATQFSAPHPHPHPHRSPSLQKEKCGAVVWQPRRLQTAPVGRVPLQDSGMCACVSAPAPAMRAARMSPAVRGRGRGRSDVTWPAGPHTPHSGSEAGRGGGGGRGRGMLGFPGPAFSRSGSIPRGQPRIGKGSGWQYQEALATLRPCSLPASEVAVSASYDATARGFGQANAV